MHNERKRRSPYTCNASATHYLPNPSYVFFSSCPFSRAGCAQGDKREHGQVGAGQCFWVDALYAGDACRAKSGSNHSSGSSGSSSSSASSSSNSNKTNGGGSSGSGMNGHANGNRPTIRIVHGAARANTSAASASSSFGAADLRTPVKRHRADSHDHSGLCGPLRFSTRILRLL